MAQNVFGQADYMMCILAYSQARDCPIRVSIDLLTKNESRKLFGFHYQLRELTQKVGFFDTLNTCLSITLSKCSYAGQRVFFYKLSIFNYFQRLPS